MSAQRLTRGLVERFQPRDKVYEVRDTTLPGFLVRVPPRGRKVYVVNWGRGRRKTLGRVGILTFDEARAKAHKLLHEVHEHGAPIAPRPAEVLTLGAFIEEHYAPWARAHRKSAQITLKRIEACFKSEFWDKRLCDLNAWIVEKWRTARLKSGIAAATTNRELAALKAALSKALEWNLVEAHPLASVKAQRTDSRAIVRYLSSDEEARLRAALARRDERAGIERERARKARGAAYKSLHPIIAANAFADHLTPAVLLSLNTGLRQGELLSLEWDDVSFERRMLTVRGDHAKSGATRHVPLNVEVLETLLRWYRQCGEPAGGVVFANRHGARITEVKTAWRALLKQARIGGFRWHDMRHHFASKLVMTGADLNTVRELLGHADLKMTLRYAHLAPEHKAAAVEKLVSVPFPEAGAGHNEDQASTRTHNPTQKLEPPKPRRMSKSGTRHDWQGDVCLRCGLRRVISHVEGDARPWFEFEERHGGVVCGFSAKPPRCVSPRRALSR